MGTATHGKAKEDCSALWGRSKGTPNCCQERDCNPWRGGEGEEEDSGREGGVRGVFWVVGRAGGCLKFVLERSVDPTIIPRVKTQTVFIIILFFLGSMNLRQVVLTRKTFL